jgi:predicted dehydrogenase
MLLFGSITPGIRISLSGSLSGRHAAATPEIIDYKGFNTLLAELEAFAAAVRGERAYPIPPEDILHGVAVFEAIVRSAERHQPITVART